ncbi:phage holin family protein [Auritidibacter ignavus]|uniref:phage holin family protein n=1 Tax=Auritidibacter ignavus TaxID=678932 RepID=UPI00109D4329|nr:phage holin family protein [Auritidibacter ignavus]
MAQKSAPAVSDQTRSSSLMDLATTGSRLVPKQLKDNLQLLKSHATSKGVTIGVGVGFAVIGLFFLFITIVALIVAMIGGFATQTNIWVAALWTALGAFVLTLILTGIGAWRIMAAMPLVPADLIRGVKHDIGYLTEGNAFDPVEFDRLEAEKAEQKKIDKEREKELIKQAQKEQKAAIKRGEAPEGIPDIKPSDDEIRHRMDLRRRHLGDIRSGLNEKTDVKAQLATFTDHALGRVDSATRAEQLRPVSSYSTAAAAGEKVNDAGEFVKDRWAPLTLLGASVTTFAVLVRRLNKKKD